MVNCTQATYMFLNNIAYLLLISSYILPGRIIKQIYLTDGITEGDTRVVQKVLQMLGFHRYKRLSLTKFVMLE